MSNRLQEIKDEYALELSELYKRSFTTWEEMKNTDYEYGNGISKWFDIEVLTDEVSKRYAKECCKASLVKGSFEALLKRNSDGELWVNQESINNENNIVIL